MNQVQVPRIIIAGAAQSVGKSLIGTGLAVALRKRNLSLSCCVSGPNLIQAVIYHRLSRRYVRCLDQKLLSGGQVVQTIRQAGLGADLVLIEGNGGLYDGYSPSNLRGSDAELAAMSGTPVVLVVDVKDLGNSIVALGRGYLASSKGFELTGIIANRVGSRGPDGQEIRDANFYNACLQSANLGSLLGAVPEIGFEIPIPRSYISQHEQLTSLPMQFFVDIGTMIAEQVAIDALLELSNRALPLTQEDLSKAPSGRRCRIAVSDDACFNLLFQDNLDLLRHFGAEVVPFSPLADSGLPKKVGAVYLTGGCLAAYEGEIAGNSSMRETLKSFADAGGVVYAEGAGAAYLCRDIALNPGSAPVPGVGVIPGSAVPGYPRFQYCETVTIEDSIFGRPGMIQKGISTGEWELAQEDQMVKVLRTSRFGQATDMDGYSPGAQVVATFDFMHWGSNPTIAKNIVDAAEVVQKL
jgi:cobyrinic acid a,c-diamide synthase